MGFGQDGYRNDTVNTEYVSGVITVGTTQVLACANGSTNLEGRQELIIFNKSINTIYFGPTGVTVGTGVPIEGGETINIQLGDQLDLYIIADSADNDVIVQELS